MDLFDGSTNSNNGWSHSHATKIVERTRRSAFQVGLSDCDERISPTLRLRRPNVPQALHTVRPPFMLMT